jgi:hypothetical protein
MKSRKKSHPLDWYRPATLQAMDENSYCKSSLSVITAVIMKKLLVLLSFITFTAISQAAVPGGETLAELILGEFDTDDDAKLTATEWQQGIGGSFSQMDKNADGFITPEELDAFQPDIANKTGEIAASVVVILIKQILMSMDSNADSKVDKKEYEGLSSGLFTKLDTDKDGSAAKSELADLPLRIIVAQ